MLIDCNRCEAVVDAKVLHSYDYFNEIVGVPTKYSFLKCPKCELPFVVVRERYGNDWDDPFRLYPQQDKAVNPLFPNTIRLSYEEAHSCYKVKAYTATAIMCRKTLEGLCDEHKIKTRNLASSLKKMKESGIIENRLFEWAEALRISENEMGSSLLMA